MYLRTIFLFSNDNQLVVYTQNMWKISHFQIIRSERRNNTFSADWRKFNVFYKLIIIMKKKKEKRRAKLKKVFFAVNRNITCHTYINSIFSWPLKKPHFVQACDIIHNSLIVSFLCHYNCVMLNNLSHKNWVL